MTDEGRGRSVWEARIKEGTRGCSSGVGLVTTPWQGSGVGAWLGLAAFLAWRMLVLHITDNSSSAMKSGDASTLLTVKLEYQCSIWG